MVTVETFRNAVKRHESYIAWRMLWALLPPLVLYLATVLGGIELSDVAIIVIIAVYVFGLMYFPSRAASHPRDEVLRCPYCERSLYAHQAIVVAYKHCPECGRRVLEEVDEETPGETGG